MNFVFIGLSITSSWGNGHAVTYRGLLRELAARGHRLLFLERNLPWYSSNRDMPEPWFCRTGLYDSLAELKENYAAEVRDADLTVVGSYVPDGIEVGTWAIRTAANPVAFYDIDTPVTLSRLATGGCEYLTPSMIPRYGLYLSFTGGSTLTRLEKTYGSPMARPLYCGVDPELYSPAELEKKYDLGYMGTWSVDRQPMLDKLLISPARAWARGRFIVAGPQYPDSIRWPANCARVQHLSPEEHRAFYNSQRFTLNITRSDMRNAGFCPSIRLFEAAACGVPIITDYWKGLDAFFDLQREILVSRSTEETLDYLRKMPESNRLKIGKKARERVLRDHTSGRRARVFEKYALELLEKTGRRKTTVP